MGKLVDWLSGMGTEKEEDSKDVSPTIKVKIFNKRLARQIKKMEIEEKKARKKAIEARKEGHFEQSKIYMKSALQFRKWANASEHFRTKMQGVLYKLEQAKALESFSGVAKDVASVLKGLNLQVKAPQISKIIGDLEAGFGSVESIMNESAEAMEVSEDSSATAVSEDEVNEELQKIDVEQGIEGGVQLPSAPSEAEAVKSSTKDAEADADMEISDLESEIQRLKSNRN